MKTIYFSKKAKIISPYIVVTPKELWSYENIASFLRAPPIRVLFTDETSALLVKISAHDRKRDYCISSRGGKTQE